MSPWFRRFLGLILLIATVGLATCQSMVKADTLPPRSPLIAFSQ